MMSGVGCLISDFGCLRNREGKSGLYMYTYKARCLLGSQLAHRSHAALKVSRADLNTHRQRR